MRTASHNIRHQLYFRCKVIPCVNEFEFNPYINDKDMLSVCKENNIVAQAYGPVGSGTANTFVGGAQEGVATHGMFMIRNQAIFLVLSLEY